MIHALVYLQAVSAWNRLLTRLRRLRNPKYLAAFLVGAIYFFFYFYRPAFFRGLSPASPSPATLPAAWTDPIELLAAVILTGVMLGSWIFPRGRAALSFTEAEAAFLFPAPVTRRTLLHYKLLRSQAGILFSTLIMAVLSQRMGRAAGAGAPGFLFAGWWLVFSLLNLHFIGASFARSRLLDLGVGPWPRRGIVLGALALTSLAAWWSSENPLSTPTPSSNPAEDLKAVMASLRHGLESQPLATLLQPARWLIRPGLAKSWPQFLSALGPALALLGLHYFWVVRSAVAFEEASLEQARRRSERLATLRRENGPAPSRAATRAPFALHPVGPAAIAFLWKNLIYAKSIFTGRTWIVLGLSFGIPALIIGLNARRGELLDVLPILLVMALVWSVLLGPQLLRHDLRQDLRSAELLKLYPLPGWKIILGELLAPVLTLSVLQLLLLLLLAALFTGIPGGSRIEFSTRLSVAAAGALVCPALNLVSFLVPNAALLLFPAWLQPGPGGAQGIEATGQRLIALFGQLVVFTFALAPGVAAAAAAYLLATIACPDVIAVPAAGAAAALLLLVESTLGIAALGKLFERLDVGAELRA